MRTNLLGIATLACLTACASDFGLAKGVDASGPAAGTPTTSSGDTAPDSDPVDDDCGVFAFAWESPVEGVIELQGEISTVDGVVVVPWDILAAETGSYASVEIDLCLPFQFRGEGVAYASEDSDSATTWSCVRQSTEEADFALVGEVAFWFEGQPLDVGIVPAPTSEGCEVATVAG